ncbi:class I SAM-dependent RNA methyltransferase [Nocardioides mangrovicus]|uniref:Class I SAM-dependent RNA methyltransferase n=1 Tax=Nocardioides mangrovicus TaxID=2478913 RepID=A0A3L8P264_9ACTN|nr:TRAM domain-containing protein [Nocardioides mangrovicus]RLV49244.1 class I SAM-dependent RNA methyltransferase [Nocardioides mangrovicus]
MSQSSVVGERYEAVAGNVAHGGHVVARPEGLDGRVVFVRHALPGERVVVEITEDGDRFLRGDAVEVLEASSHRVEPPCPYAGPGACGGCDFQHATPAYQRSLKTSVVREQLERLAGIASDVEVEEVPPTLRWRSRMRYVDLPGGRKGLRQHRSHEVVEIDDCLIDAHGPVPVVEEVAQQPSRNPRSETVDGHRFAVEPDGFWQPHVRAPEVLVDCVLDFLAPRPGESALDLYAGVGLFAAHLGDDVIAVEGDRKAAAHAADNTTAEVVCSDVQRWLERGATPDHVDLVVLDPPRVGAKKRVVAAIAALSPRAVAYVACDPAALARDLAIFAGHGYRPQRLRAFDLFPMTHHVECVALLEAGR